MRGLTSLPQGSSKPLSSTSSKVGSCLPLLVLVLGTSTRLAGTTSKPARIQPRPLLRTQLKLDGVGLVAGARVVRALLLVRGLREQESVAPAGGIVAGHEQERGIGAAAVECVGARKDERQGGLGE